MKLKFFLVFMAFAFLLPVWECFASCSYSYQVYTYSCVPGCGSEGGGIQLVVCSYTKCCGEDCDPPPPICSKPTMVSYAEDWQVCRGGPQVWVSTVKECGPCDGECGCIAAHWKSTAKFYYLCTGACLESPEEARYYNDPEYPTGPDPDPESEFHYYESSEDSTNIDLPVKVDWDDDPNWQEDAAAPPQFAERPARIYWYEPMSGAGPQSYVIKVDIPEYLDPQYLNEYEIKNPNTADQWENPSTEEEQLAQGFFERVLNLENLSAYYGGDTVGVGFFRASEYNLRNNHNACLLSSNSEYEWSVKTCCYEDGFLDVASAFNVYDQGLTNCSEPTYFSFATSYSPELKSPEDLDWDGEGYSAWDEETPFDWQNQNAHTEGGYVDIPVTLDWCDNNLMGTREPASELFMSENILVYLFEDNDKTKTTCPPHKYVTDGDICLPIVLQYNFLEPEKGSLYDDEDVYVFTESTGYNWQVNPCTTIWGTVCKDYGQEWSFKTAKTDLGTDMSIEPANGSIVGIPTSIAWTPHTAYNSNFFELYEGGTLISSDQGLSFSRYFDSLKLNTQYKWRVKNCTDFEKYTNCSDWTEFFTFTTTGAAPTLESPQNGQNEVSIPVNLKWKSVGGEKSYILKISGPDVNYEKITSSSNNSLDFSDEFKINPGESYSWQVKTCSDTEGKNCGEYSEAWTFKTIELEGPQGLSPSSKEFSPSEKKEISWEEIPEAKAYQIKITYSSKAENETLAFCDSELGETYYQTSSDNSLSFSLKCYGDYSWAVRGCISYQCEEESAGEWSSSASFSIKDDGSSSSGGSSGGSSSSGKTIVPCGRYTDDPNTPWNEREDCEIKHLVILIKNIIDLILWQIIPILLVIMVMITGVIFYLSLGGTETIISIKSLWRAVGIGLLIAFFAWLAIDILLLVIGYKVDIFGEWWNI